MGLIYYFAHFKS